MLRGLRGILVLSIIASVCSPVLGRQRGRANVGGYGYRENADFVVKRMGLRKGDVVVDIGAGDGWWSSKFAEKIGPKGVVHAGEVDQKKVDAMKKKWESIPQIKPYLCPADGTGLEPNSCDVAFISKTFHHLDKDKHVEYLEHLKEVIKPSGRVVIVERHPSMATGRGAEHAWLPGHMSHEAERAGWMLIRMEFVKGSDHFMATYVQPKHFTAKFHQRREAAKKKQSQAQKE